MLRRTIANLSQLRARGKPLTPAIPRQPLQRRHYAAKRRPLHEMEAEREPFQTMGYTMTRTPDTKWQVGSGLVSAEQHKRRDEFKADRKKVAFNTAELSPGDNYKLLINGVIPRPIAFVSSQDAQGKRNLAPYSFFNASGHDPPTVMISMNTGRGEHAVKDSLSNIYETKKFVVNIISEPFTEAANYTCIDAPHDISEWALSGLTPQQPYSWDGQGPPRVGESAFAMECEYKDRLEIKNDQGKVTTTIVVGRVLHFVLNEDLRDEHGAISPDKLLPVSRGGGISYLRSSFGFEVARPVWDKEGQLPAVQACLEKGKEDGK